VRFVYSELFEGMGTNPQGRQKAEDEKAGAHEQISELKADQIRLQEQLAASRTEAGQLREDLRRMTAEKDRQAEESSSLLALNKELKQQVQDCQKQGEQLRQDLKQENQKATNLENNLNHLIGEKEDLTDTSNSQAAEILKLKTTVSGLEARVDDRNIKIGQLEKENSQLQEDRQQAITLQAELENSKGRIRELSQETGELKQENKTLHKQTGELEGRLKALDGKQ